MWRREGGDKGRERDGEGERGRRREVIVRRITLIPARVPVVDTLKSK